MSYFITSNSVGGRLATSHVYDNGYNMPYMHGLEYVSEWYESEFQPQNIKLNHKFNVWWNIGFKVSRISWPSTEEL